MYINTTIASAAAQQMTKTTSIKVKIITSNNPKIENTNTTVVIRSEPNRDLFSLQNNVGTVQFAHKICIPSSIFQCEKSLQNELPPLIPMNIVACDYISFCNKC